MADCWSSEGRGAAAEVDAWLSGVTRLPSAGGIKTRVSFFRLFFSHISKPFSGVCSTSQQADGRNRCLVVGIVFLNIMYIQCMYLPCEPKYACLSDRLGRVPHESPHFVAGQHNNRA